MAATNLDATRSSPLFGSRWRQIPESFPSGRGNTPSNSATYSVAHPRDIDDSLTSGLLSACDSGRPGQRRLGDEMSAMPTGEPASGEVLLGVRESVHSPMRELRDTAAGGAKFCFECATPVSAPGAASRFASPEAYTPKHLAERIINSKAALEGERKQVTVLFADLKGSMELLADRDPEEARKILDPVLERM